MKRSISCEQAKQFDLVDYLASLGHFPKKNSHNDYWYLSPFRQEKTPSFKVNKKLNVWYDHGVGKGGNLIDFGTQYFNCSVSDLLARLTSHLPIPSLSFQQPFPNSKSLPIQNVSADEKKAASEGKIVVVDARPLLEKSLLRYLVKRCIPLEIASRFCKEVDFLLHDKKYTAIGFPNDAGGYELRSENFKGSSSPKSITLMDNSSDRLAVFEGFFSFLSYCVINQNKSIPLTNCLVLNSLAFFEKSRSLMEQHKEVNLYLDRDNAGITHTRKALQWDKGKYIDRSNVYPKAKDFNDFLVHPHHPPQQHFRIGRQL